MYTFEVENMYNGEILAQSTEAAQNKDKWCEKANTLKNQAIFTSDVFCHFLNFVNLYLIREYSTSDIDAQNFPMLTKIRSVFT